MTRSLLLSMLLYNLLVFVGVVLIEGVHCDFDALVFGVFGVLRAVLTGGHVITLILS